MGLMVTIMIRIDSLSRVAWMGQTVMVIHAKT